MADTNEIIHSFSVSNQPIGFFIKGGRIYVLRRGTATISAYNYAGEHIRDHTIAGGGYGVEEVGGRFYVSYLGTGIYHIDIRHYNCELIRNVNVGMIQRSIRVRYARLWIAQHDASYTYELHYDGSTIRRYSVGDTRATTDIRYGRFYVSRGYEGKMRIANKGGEEITTRGGEVELYGMRVRGGRFITSDYGDNVMRIVNYAYFNIL